MEYNKRDRVVVLGRPIRVSEYVFEDPVGTIIFKQKTHSGIFYDVEIDDSSRIVYNVTEFELRKYEKEK